MPNLLIVDDFAPVRMSLRRYLEARGLGKCFEASNGVEALRVAKHGATAAKVFYEKMPDVPVLMFTAHGATVQRMLPDVPLFGIFSKDNITLLVEAIVKCLRATAMQ